MRGAPRRLGSAPRARHGCPSRLRQAAAAGRDRARVEVSRRWQTSRVEPSVERFRALARSAPWRWTTLHLTCRWTGGTAVQAVLARPDRLRVEDLDGRLLAAGTSGGLGSSSGPRPPAPEPRLDADGLVRSRREPWNDGPDVPMWQDYRWVAALDPYELADGVEGEPGADIHDLHAVEHHGRLAWEAVLVPTPAYEPRCGCCPLLRSRESDLLEGLPLLPVYAEAHQVRLDVQTGVCVLTAELGGPSPGAGHDTALLAVDEPAPDVLFTPQHP